MDLIRRLARSSAAHVAFGFVAMGGWAVFANRHHPMPAPLVAGAVQGVITATITGAMKWIMDRVHGATASVPLAVLAACAASLVTITTLHTLAGTPELWATISVPWSIGVVYATLYTLTLHRTRKAAP